MKVFVIDYNDQNGESSCEGVYSTEEIANKVMMWGGMLNGRPWVKLKSAKHGSTLESWVVYEHTIDSGVEVSAS